MGQCNPKRAIAITLAAFLFLMAWKPAGAEDAPTEAAKRVAAEISREAQLPPNGPNGRPLPLASHWNTGTVRGTFGPDHQIGLIQAGHHILPWMAWPEHNPDSKQFIAYYQRLLTYFASLDLPISMRGTQWNQMLVKGEYKKLPDDQWAGVIRLDGKHKSQLSPFGAIDPWSDPADLYVASPGMKWAQQTYPDPPRVLWVSNNEPSSLHWAKNGPLEINSKRYLEAYGLGRSDEFKRRVVGEGWIERYQRMFEAMRNALVEPAWKENVRFVGYGAFGPSHFGRGGFGFGRSWKVHSLVSDAWTAPSWFYWQGASPSYYSHNWSEISDYRVFSNQVESMNWVFMLREAWRTNPDFWFEISVWDGSGLSAWQRGIGAESGADLARLSSTPLTEEARQALDADDLKKSKVLQYMKEGQDFPPERTAGWVQFGMWLMRPRVVREFRSHATPLEPVLPYWMELVDAVDRVWENEVLADFWRFGELLANRQHPHPYQDDIPEKYRDIPRWYLLDTDLDPPRPWDLMTELPVFSLSLVRGEPGMRSWLVYAHSPLRNHADVRLHVPGFGDIVVDVTRAGRFYLVAENDRSVEGLKLE